MRVTLPRVYRWIDHTAELELAIEAPTAEEVVAEAAAALAELLGGGRGVPAGTRAIAVDAGDRAALLAVFVEELVYLAESESLIPTGVHEVRLEDDQLRAEVDFEHGDPPHLVKAVTYHRLTFERHDAGYRATAVLDV